MTDQYLKLGLQALELAFFVSAPILILSLCAGLIVSIFQAATQISDSSLTFIPKIFSVGLGLALFGNFMLNKLTVYMIEIYESIALVTR